MSVQEFEVIPFKWFGVIMMFISAIISHFSTSISMPMFVAGLIIFFLEWIKEMISCQ